MSKPTKEQFDEAIRVIRSYAPEVFLNVQPMETKNQHANDKLDYLVYHDGYFNICSRITGEILKANVFCNIKDHCDKPLSAKAEFHLTHGKVAGDDVKFSFESVITSKQEHEYYKNNNPKKRNLWQRIWNR